MIIQGHQREYPSLLRPVSPRSMRVPEVRAARLAMLDQPHIQPLSALAADIRAQQHVEVPEFDPLDGGIDARILFLFEKPGPMTSASRTGKAGSGFISRDNDDPSAEATFRFMETAGIPREDTVTWNVVPGWNGTRKITAQELAAGVADAKRLLERLHAARTVVLVGKKAARATKLFSSAGFAVFESPHPSPLVRAKYPERWSQIPDIWRAAYKSIPKA
ncbi:uracil-DNA glycosylase [Brevundimonas sp.]|uniref:uracil-DNA glycosylase n=1 Tax=Brevundimonas sp. TaxID=1871086 RepID=UPI00289F353C|nr:uracil-DNA glycosylase [Brevundimonas sp.]